MKFKSDIEVQAGLRDGGNDIGTAGQILSSTGSQTNWIDQDSIVASEAKLVFIECKNTSGVTISKGTPVYQTGTVGATDVIEVDAADASDEDKMAAIGLLQTDLANNAFGKVVITGELLNITTSPIDGVTPVTGDTIYVKSGGGLTLTKPTGVNFIQNIGLVGKVSGGSAGSITVSSIMRSNDVPTPLYVDHTNQRLGIGVTPSQPLDVNGTALIRNTVYVGDNIQHWGDGGTGLYFGTDTLSLQNNGGNTRLYIQSGGNVGIGTTSPAAKLDVRSTASNYVATFKHSTGTGYAPGSILLEAGQGNARGQGIYHYNNVADENWFTGVPYNVDSKKWIVANKYSTTQDVDTAQLNYALLTIDSDTGNVGIGTTSPLSKLHLRGGTNVNLQIGSVGTELQIKATNDADSAYVPMILRASEYNILNGNVGIGTTSPGATLELNSDTGNAAKLKIGRQNGTTNYLELGTSGGSSVINAIGIAGIYADLIFNRSTTTATNESMRITGAGNVGIGTTSPSTKLQVDSSTAFSLTNGSGDTLLLTNDSTVSAIGAIGPSIGFGNMNNNNRTSAIATVRTGGDHDNMGLAFFTHPSNTSDETVVQKMTITHEGNVGIGITGPLQPLSIENSSSPLIKIRCTTNGSGAAIEFNDNGASAANQNGRISYYHSDSLSQGGGSSFWLTGEDDQTLVLANNGRVVVQKSGSTTEVGYGFYDDTNTGMYRVSADALGFATGGTRRLDMNNSGVRIGTGSRVSTILDQDNMSSNSNTALATQQSIKAYVDNSVAAIITPAAPSTVTSTIVGETIEIAFNQSTTSDIDYYQVWSSDDGGDYGIIGQITSDDFSATMTVVDTTFVTGGTMSYRVYAVRQGVYSSAATTSKSYTVSALSVTNMTVVNLNTAYYIQYEKPNSRFIDHIEIWMDSQTTQAALNRTNATLVYSGQNHSYMRNVNTSNNFHQFWVEIVTS